MVSAKCLASNVRMATVNNIPNLIDIMLGQCPIPFCVAPLCFMITPNSESFDESAPAYTDIHGMCHRHAVIVADPPTTVAGASIVNDKFMTSQFVKPPGQGTGGASRNRPSYFNTAQKVRWDHTT